jgi:hypothetical protein
MPDGEATSYRLAAEDQVHMLRRLMLYWDGQWFLKAVEAFGLDAAVDLNARVRSSFGRIEMRLLLKAVGRAQAADLFDAMRLIELYTQAFLGKAMRAEFVAVGAHRSQVIVRHCPAYEGAKLAGLPRQDQACLACCGLWRSWLDTLLPGSPVTVDCPSCQGMGDQVCSFVITMAGDPQAARTEHRIEQTRLSLEEDDDVYCQGL